MKTTYISFIDIYIVINVLKTAGPATDDWWSETKLVYIKINEIYICMSHYIYSVLIIHYLIVFYFKTMIHQ